MKRAQPMGKSLPKRDTLTLLLLSAIVLSSLEERQIWHPIQMCIPSTSLSRTVGFRGQ